MEKLKVRIKFKSGATKELTAHNFYKGQFREWCVRNFVKNEFQAYDFVIWNDCYVNLRELEYIDEI